jgi:hypothetical protein
MLHPDTCKQCRKRFGILEGMPIFVQEVFDEDWGSGYVLCPALISINKPYIDGHSYRHISQDPPEGCSLALEHLVMAEKGEIQV